MQRVFRAVRTPFDAVKPVIHVPRDERDAVLRAAFEFRPDRRGIDVSEADDLIMRVGKRRDLRRQRPHDFGLWLAHRDGQQQRRHHRNR